MKISLQMELLTMKEQQTMKGTPVINANSKKLAERKLLETSLLGSTGEVYDRLYEIGKKRQIFRNANEDSVFTPGKERFGSTQKVGGEIRHENSFRPLIQKKSQLLKREKSIDQHLYEDFIERCRKQEAKGSPVPHRSVKLIS